MDRSLAVFRTQKAFERLFGKFPGQLVVTTDDDGSMRVTNPETGTWGRWEWQYTHRVKLIDHGDPENEPQPRTP